jgi:small subunit ribosomal protein S13
MSRISGVELADNWKVDYALTRIKGIGWSLSRKIVAKVGIPQAKRISDLEAPELAKINSELDNYLLEGDLVRAVRANIARLVAIGSYRGMRHHHNLPVRGQRTRTNARTKRGKKKTVGAFKKEALSAQKVASNKAQTEVKK